jgi:hypothetical protein
VAVHGHNHLAPIGVTPFLMTASLADQPEAVLPQDPDNFLGVANWVAAAHGIANSKSLARLLILTGTGLNQRESASFALAMASSSVSPAEAQPGSSRKTADHRLVTGSSSTNKRNFMAIIYPAFHPPTSPL